MLRGKLPALLQKNLSQQKQRLPIKNTFFQKIKKTALCCAANFQPHSKTILSKNTSIQKKKKIRPLLRGKLPARIPKTVSQQKQKLPIKNAPLKKRRKKPPFPARQTLYLSLINSTIFGNAK
ncbi:hypothetical protein GFS24_17570 [Chitinophaga sp. SYP-B3965]|uniref:hypothetical protein n=1 Tax=Chitinophaga sp. SYP-B3965 TaxID=2663120 RepID=UPI0012999B86|nr:hypothetical protein [Chitinophaga sp. SYP-B3965]MRG46935.1 hypothetical protein [Chitinophaga sp. SYP-B3965]